jgi:hypothetical protein
LARTSSRGSSSSPRWMLTTALTCIHSTASMAQHTIAAHLVRTAHSEEELVALTKVPQLLRRLACVVTPTLEECTSLLERVFHQKFGYKRIHNPLPDSLHRYRLQRLLPLCKANAIARCVLMGDGRKMSGAESFMKAGGGETDCPPGCSFVLCWSLCILVWVAFFMPLRCVLIDNDLRLEKCCP